MSETARAMLQSKVCPGAAQGALPMSIEQGDVTGGDDLCHGPAGRVDGRFPVAPVAHLDHLDNRDSTACQYPGGSSPHSCTRSNPHRACDGVDLVDRLVREEAPRILGMSPSLRMPELLDDLPRVPCGHLSSNAGDEVEGDEAGPGVGGDQRVVKLTKSAYLEARHVEIAA